MSLTCDDWQASNTDGYFAVTGHWIEEPQPGVWGLHSTFFGFVWLNNAHNGKRLGFVLFKIVDQLGITHKVSMVFDLICIVDIFTHIKHDRLDTLLVIMPQTMT